MGEPAEARGVAPRSAGAEIGAALARLRRRTGMSQETVARGIPLSRNQYHAIEHGMPTRTPTIDAALRVMGYTFADLARELHEFGDTRVKLHGQPRRSVDMPTQPPLAVLVP